MEGNEIKVLGLKVDNFARVKNLKLWFEDLSPAICVCGKNESGKSSAIGALYSALCGVTPKNPVYNNDGKATITVALGNNGNVEYEVTRVITNSSSKLEVLDVDGNKIASPGKFLNDLIGKVAFDPSTFQKLDNKGRLDILCEAAGIDVAELENRHDKAYKERRKIGVKLKALPKVTHVEKVEPVDTSAINETRRKLEEKRLEAESYLLAQERQAELIIELEEKVRKAREVMDNEYSKFAVDPKSFDAKINECIEKIDNAVEISKQAEAYKRNEEVKAEKKELDALYNEQDSILDRIKLEKERAVKKIGIEELSIGMVSGVLEYDKIAFDSLSQSKKLTVSLDVLTSINSRLKFCVVRDAMYYDDDNFKMICDKLTSRGYTVMFEIVGNPNGKKGFVMVDGEVDSIVQ